MIIGAHSIIYSTRPEADRAFLRDVLRFPHVDVGEGWLIFGLPPSEVAVHPSGKNDIHEFLICKDIAEFVSAMKGHGIVCASVQNEGWGLLTHVTLPGGGKLGVYQPRHARPKSMLPAKRAKKTGKKPAKKPATRPAGKSSPAARRGKVRNR